MAEEDKQPEITRQELERDDKGRLLPGQQSLNPEGRPTGSVSLTAIIKRKLQEAPPGQRQALAELLAEKILDEAYVKGNAHLIKEIWHYTDGMPKQSVAIDADKESLETLTSFFREVANSKQATKTNDEPKQ